VTIRCHGRIELVPQASGDTEVNVFHRHTMVGGAWSLRWSMPSANRNSTERVFRETIESCRAAVVRSTAQSQ
jgi:hypothetical protein